MTRTVLSILLLGLFSGFSLFAQSDSLATLELEFTGIRSCKGQIAISVNISPKGFPHKSDFELQFKKDQMEDGVLNVQVRDLPYGTYAISVLDDVNSNQEMEMFLGMPKEGYGFSLNPQVRLRAPKFKECSFELNQPFHKITIELRYRKKEENPSL